MNGTNEVCPVFFDWIPPCQAQFLLARNAEIVSARSNMYQPNEHQISLHSRISNYPRTSKRLQEIPKESVVRDCHTDCLLDRRFLESQVSRGNAGFHTPSRIAFSARFIFETAFFIAFRWFVFPCCISSFYLCTLLAAMFLVFSSNVASETSSCFAGFVDVLA